MTASQKKPTDMSAESERDHRTADQRSIPRIGLALSGGGFRASFFHLGVIQHLEEIGLMKYIDTISAVSGGAIIASYYQLVMKEQLAEHFSDDKDIDEERMKIFRKIKCKFMEIANYNLRTKSLIFGGQFYHPIKFFKFLRAILVPTYNQSDLIEHEFERKLFHESTLASLCYKNSPSESKLPKGSTGRCWKDIGPRIVINSTSLITGRLKTFIPCANPCANPCAKDKPRGGGRENAVRLSKIVGASMAVPGLFGSRAILGDQLVDGGVLDNQGLDYLISPDSQFQIIIVSDASGQLKTVHRNIRYFRVLMRVIELTLHREIDEIRNRLDLWKSRGKKDNKDRGYMISHIRCANDGKAQSLPRDLIEEIAAIRTDLDQFGRVEIEALMYHGHMNMKSELKEFKESCNSEFKEWMGEKEDSANEVDLADEYPVLHDIDTKPKRHQEVKKILSYGRFNVYLWRSIRKHPWLVLEIILVGGVILTLLWTGAWEVIESMAFLILGRIELVIEFFLSLTWKFVDTFLPQLGRDLAGRIFPLIKEICSGLAGKIFSFLAKNLVYPYLFYLGFALGFQWLTCEVKRLDKRKYDALSDL